MERKLDNLKPTTYSGAVGAQNTKFNGTNTIVNLPKNVVRGLADLSRASKQEEEAERLKRTRVVIRPGDTAIRTSPDIRREFNKHFKGVIILQCRITASGSIFYNV